MMATATNNLAEAQKLASTRDASRIKLAQVDVHPKTVSEALQSVLSTADVVISLVPATLHLPVAESCIQLGTPLVTASYISPGMKALDAKAKTAGVAIMNEVGLDPGIDHLTAKQFIDDVVQSGGKIEGFTSWCGGLPAPENSDNPLGSSNPFFCASARVSHSQLVLIRLQVLLVAARRAARGHERGRVSRARSSRVYPV